MTDPTDYWLHCNTRRSCPHIQCEQHETGSTQRRQLPEWTESMQQGRMPFFIIKQFHHTTKQWSSPQHIPHNKTCNVIGNRSKIGGFIHQYQGGGIHQNHFGRNGTHTAPHSTSNIYFYGRSGRQWQDTTKANKGHGYALPLAERQRVPKAIQNKLETRKIQLCRLLDKVSYLKIPLEHSEEISHATIVLEMLIIEQQNPTKKATQTAWHKIKALARVWWYEQ